MSFSHAVPFVVHTLERVESMIGPREALCAKQLWSGASAHRNSNARGTIL